MKIQEFEKKYYELKRLQKKITTCSPKTPLSLVNRDYELANTICNKLVYELTKIKKDVTN